MFIKRNKKIDPITKREYSTYQLVESFRTSRGPRQRILLSLNVSLDHLEKDQLKDLANRIEQIISGESSLFHCSDEIERLAQTFAKLIIKKQTYEASNTVTESFEDSEDSDFALVNLNSLSNEDCHTLGIENILYKTFCELKLPKKLRSLGFSDEQIHIAAAIIIGRAAFPASELATHHWLLHDTALDELMQADFSKLTLYKWYQISDILLEHKQALEKHLSDTCKEIFHLKEKIILYDITNTYFEGLASKNKKATYGRSKEKRSDCPLVALGLVLDGDGFAKKSEIFEGNVVETNTFQAMICKLDQGGNLFKPIIVMDAGIASDVNVSWLKENGYPYIVVQKKKTQQMPQDVPPILVKEEEGNRVWVAKKENPETKEIFLYCQSEARGRREGKIKIKREEILEAELQKLNDGLNKTTNTIKKYDKVLEKIGRLKEKYKKTASYYNIEVEHCAETGLATKIVWKKNSSLAAKKLTGVYCLRTPIKEMSEKQLWEIYMMLSELEDAFRCMKSELGLRPVFHQKEERVDGHIFIALLGYHLVHVIRQKLKLKGINLRWDNIRKEMRKQMRVTTYVKNYDGQLIRIRNTSKAEEFHKEIYNALGMPYNPLRSVKTTTNHL
jgi:transposase